jgi:RNA-binding protein YhbY
MIQEQISENDENLESTEVIKQKFANSKPTFTKTILTEYENICYTAAGKRGLTANQVAEIICKGNPKLLQEKELIEILKAWNTDRNDLKDYRKRERLANKL